MFYLLQDERLNTLYSYGGSLDTRCLFEANLASLNDNSFINYMSGFRAWKVFAKSNNLKIFPSVNAEFCIFLVESMKEGASWATLNKFICGAKFFHKILEVDNLNIPENLCNYLKKFCRKPNAEKRPIEVNEVYSILELSKIEPSSLTLFRDLAIVLFGFFGFCRFDDFAQIRFADFSFDDNVYSVKIRNAKNDKFFKGQSLSFELDSFCDYILKMYLKLSKPFRTRRDSFLFLNLSKSKPKDVKMSYREARNAVLSLCIRANVDVSSIGTHSFRIGAATLATRRGVPDAHIERHGRWALGSSAKNRYQRVSRDDHIVISRCIRK